MSLDVKFKIIEHRTADYKSAVLLRERILRAPFDLHFSDAELLAEKAHVQIVGLNGSEVIATAVLVPEGQCCKMQRVVVKEDLANTGIGSQMMTFCEDYAKKHGFETIYCHARDSAVNFYLKNGYEAEDDYFSEDTIPHLKMRKVL
ncbi:MAG TPA: GNAT family N-acetyltransferase [Gammaproteobacteria bacterium]|nr:GNAT family N-acetyltransferase [Gammaproteobacteria bacterium]